MTKKIFSYEIGDIINIISKPGKHDYLLVTGFGSDEKNNDDWYNIVVLSSNAYPNAIDDDSQISYETAENEYEKVA